MSENCRWMSLFWTVERFDGQQSVEADAPLDRLPLFVKAGSILSMGDFVQYAGEKPADELEICIYEGANGEFTLYEDEGDNYNYEEGVFSTIPFSWNDASKTLTIGESQGAYPEMLRTQKFKVVLVAGSQGTVIDKTTVFYQEVVYEGKKVVVGL